VSRMLVALSIVIRDPACSAAVTDRPFGRSEPANSQASYRVPCREVRPESCAFVCSPPSLLSQEHRGNPLCSTRPESSSSQRSNLRGDDLPGPMGADEIRDRSRRGRSRPGDRGRCRTRIASLALPISLNCSFWTVGVNNKRPLFRGLPRTIAASRTKSPATKLDGTGPPSELASQIDQGGGRPTLALSHESALAVTVVSALHPPGIAREDVRLMHRCRAYQAPAFSLVTHDRVQASPTLWPSLARKSPAIVPQHSLRIVGSSESGRTQRLPLAV
jgi:hypothetical protein